MKTLKILLLLSFKKTELQNSTCVIYDLLYTMHYVANKLFQKNGKAK